MKDLRFWIGFAVLVSDDGGMLARLATAIAQRPGPPRGSFQRVRSLARAMYRELELQGFDEQLILALATELISQVTARISRSDRPR